MYSSSCAATVTEALSQGLLEQVNNQCYLVGVVDTTPGSMQLIRSCLHGSYLPSQCFKSHMVQVASEGATTEPLSQALGRISQTPKCHQSKRDRESRASVSTAAHDAFRPPAQLVPDRPNILHVIWKYFLVAAVSPTSAGASFPSFLFVLDLWHIHGR